MVLAIAFACLFSTDVKAQLSLGGGIAYGLDIEEIGIQVKGIYAFDDTWRANADFIFYLDGIEDASVWELNLNGNYVFSSTDDFLVYALAGLNIAGLSVTFLGETVSATETGLNIGAGGQLFVSDNVSILGELKYAIGNADQLVIAAGVQFALGGN